MQTEVQETITRERLSGLFEKNRSFLSEHDTPALSEIREKAFASFVKLGFPDIKQESWRLTDLTESFARGYDYPLRPDAGANVQEVFRCNIPHLDTAIIGQLNGWYVSKDVPLMELGNGIIMGSLAQARIKYPELVEKYYGTMIVP
jgi:Fe-S cluster assembly protein SufD